MEMPDEMKKSFEAMRNRTLHDEIEKARELRTSATTLFKEFEGGLTEELKDKHVELLEKLKYFEKNLINHEVLNFFYAIIARVALNGCKFDEAIEYAQAGIEANEKHNDVEGIKTNRVVILDTACLMNANEEAVKIFDKYPDIADPKIKDMLKQAPSKNIDLFQKLLNSAKRPKSLVFCLDDKLKAEEKAIRTVMLHMGVSRSTALKYKREADNLSK
jgi:hypothetical protein